MIHDPTAGHQAFLLFQAPAPGSKGLSPAETPTLQPFVLPPGKNNIRASVIVLPGGGYIGLAPHEGEPVARWLNQLGINAFVLRYRVTPNYHPAPLNDARRAIRFVRHHAAAWELDLNRIGILGFSAGGHLASTLCTHFEPANPEAADPLDRPSTRPNLQILLYPVISLKNIVQQRSFSNLLGANPSPDLLESVSNDLHVTAQTPPAFLFHSTLDSMVPVAHSDNYAAALKKHGVSHTFVRGEFGEHGIGLHECWTAAAAKFLREQGF